MNDITIICDNGGGVTLQVIQGDRRYQAHYPCAEPYQGADPVRDIRAALAGDDIRSWDGNSLDVGQEWLGWTVDDIRNGGLIVLGVEGLLDPEFDAHGWANARILSQRLRQA